MILGYTLLVAVIGGLAWKLDLVCRERDACRRLLFKLVFKRGPEKPWEDFHEDANREPKEMEN